MKKFVTYLGTIIISLIVTFVTFETLSWYHFGDIPTTVVSVRLIIFFCVIECLFILTLSLIRKFKK
jgi:hypothetical protein